MSPQFSSFGSMSQAFGSTGAWGSYPTAFSTPTALSSPSWNPQPVTTRGASFNYVATPAFQSPSFGTTTQSWNPTTATWNPTATQSRNPTQIQSPAVSPAPVDYNTMFKPTKNVPGAPSTPAIYVDDKDVYDKEVYKGVDQKPPKIGVAASENFSALTGKPIKGYDFHGVIQSCSTPQPSGCLLQNQIVQQLRAQSATNDIVLVTAGARSDNQVIIDFLRQYNLIPEIKRLYNSVSKWETLSDLGATTFYDDSNPNLATIASRLNGIQLVKVDANTQQQTTYTGATSLQGYGGQPGQVVMSSFGQPQGVISSFGQPQGLGMGGGGYPMNFARGFRGFGR